MEKFREIVRNIGARSIVAALLAFLLTVAVTFTGGTLLYRETKESMLLQGENNAIQAAKEFDRYLLVRQNAVELVAQIVEDMVESGRANTDIVNYITVETQLVQERIDPDITGFYGWVNGAYCDGAGWVPDADYVPTQRPWYRETVTDGGPITFVKPYLDEWSKTVMMTIAALLKDGESVVALDVSLNRIQELTEQIAAQTPDSCGVVLDKDGQVVAHSDEGELGKNYLEEEGTLGAALAEKLFKQNQRQFELSFRGSHYLVYAEDIEGGWKSVALINTATYYRPLNTILSALILLTVLEAVVFAAVFYRLAAKNLAISVQNVQLGAMADMYVSIYDVDIRTDSIRAVKRNGRQESAQEFWGGLGNAQQVLSDMIQKNVDEMFRPQLARFVDLKTLEERLGSTDTATEEFLDKDKKWCRGRFVAAAREKDGRPIRALWMVEAIDAEKRHRDTLKSLSETDQMTGLNNRVAGENRITRLIGQGVGGMFVMLDVDKFKSINDNFGHDVGDKVIIAIADALTKAFRSDDVLMRLGGDEFVAYAPGVLTQALGRPIIERVFANILAARIEELGDTRVFVSVGAAFCQDHELRTFKELYRGADACSYESKKEPGNAVTFEHRDA